MDKLIISGAPHQHSGDSVRRNMLLVIAALIPAYAVSIAAFGWGAIWTMLISVATCILFEWLIAKFILKQQPTLDDCSAILTGMLLALNLPSNIPWWIIMIGSLVAIGVGKMAFGGIGQNVFNPALVGRVFLLISFPAQMTTWPLAQSFNTSYVDAATGATPLAAMKELIKTGNSSVLDELPTLWEMFVGAMGGSFGEVCAFALIAGGLLLICTRVITWHIPVVMLATMACFAGCSALFGLIPESVGACNYMGMTVLTGGAMLGAFFMATDYTTSPMTPLGKCIYAFGIGLIAMVIRTWGSYPEGVSFAILIMNACVPLINRIQPRRFGTKKVK